MIKIQSGFTISPFTWDSSSACYRKLLKNRKKQRKQTTASKIKMEGLITLKDIV
jgi:hypothetical protein